MIKINYDINSVLEKHMHAAYIDHGTIYQIIRHMMWKLFKCGDSENSFSFESYMAFSIKCLLFWETSLIAFEYGMLLF